MAHVLRKLSVFISQHLSAAIPMLLTQDFEILFYHGFLHDVFFWSYSYFLAIFPQFLGWPCYPLASSRDWGSLGLCPRLLHPLLLCSLSWEGDALSSWFHFSQGAGLHLQLPRLSLSPVLLFYVPVEHLHLGVPDMALTNHCPLS